MLNSLLWPAARGDSLDWGGREALGYGEDDVGSGCEMADAVSSGGVRDGRGYGVTIGRGQADGGARNDGSAGIADVATQNSRLRRGCTQGCSEKSDAKSREKIAAKKIHVAPNHVCEGEEAFPFERLTPLIGSVRAFGADASSLRYDWLASRELLRRSFFSRTCLSAANIPGGGEHALAGGGRCSEDGFNPGKQGYCGCCVGCACRGDDHDGVSLMQF